MTIHNITAARICYVQEHAVKSSQSCTGRKEFPAAAGANGGGGTQTTEAAYGKQQFNNPPNATQSGPITDVLRMAIPNTNYPCPAKATKFSQNITLCCENTIMFV